MSIEIFPRNFDSKPYDGCGNTTIATLEINGMQIPLCETCLDELELELKSFKSITFCYMCKHYVPNPYGNNYSGYCKKEAIDKGIIIKESDIGYTLIKDFFETCEHATKMETME